MLQDPYLLSDKCDAFGSGMVELLDDLGLFVLNDGNATGTAWTTQNLCRLDFLFYKSGQSVYLELSRHVLL